MKIRNKIVSFIALVCVCVLCFAGCEFSPAVKRASKNLTTYAIDATLCDQEKKISAVERVEYVNSKDTILNSVQFNLYGKAFSEEANIKPYSKQKMESCFPNGINYGDMQINGVLVEGQNATYNIVGEDNNALEVLLLEPLYEGEKVEIVIEFVLYLANCTHRLGYNDNSINLGNWYPIAAVFENGEFVTDPYYANGDPFYSDCANYEVKISYSDKYKLASSGELVDSKTESGVKTDTFKALAVRDFAMCFASDYVVKSSELDGIIISVYAYEGDGNLDVYLETSLKAVSLFNELFGKYPYNTLNVAFTDFFQGGMEYPNLVYISDSVEDLTEIKKVIVHEIAHEWWYGVVGDNEVKDAWFDEGLAEYSTLLYFEHYPEEGIDAEKLVTDTIINYELYLDVVNSLNLSTNYAMNLNVDEYTTEYEYVYMIYVKGLLFYDNLRDTIGDKCFFKFLQVVYKNYSFKNINKELFVAELEKVTGLNMNEFVESWLSGKVDISQN